VSSTIINTVFALAMLLAVIANAAAEIKEDPLRPPGYRDAGAGVSTRRNAPSWHVNEILISDSRRVAIVNANSVKLGDSVNGARVVAIEPGYVTLEYNNRLITARLTMVPVKRRVTARAEK
jgi:MSHA biogenesis protein MshK